MFVGFFTVIYYVTLMAWSFALFFDAWKSPFPWVLTDEQKKELADAKKNMTEKERNSIKTSDLWNPDYFYKKTLNRSASIGETGTLNA